MNVPATSGLVWAALALIDAPLSTGQLVERFAAEGAGVAAARAEELLGQLSGLGLVRIAETRPNANERRFVRTLLGEQLVRDSVGHPGLLAERLEELERLRTDLFSTVAHELRTPLTTIRTSVGLLLDPNTEAHEEQRRQLLNAIERNAERLQQLSDDVLDLTRFRTGHIQLGRRRFDARELPAEVVEDLDPSLRAKSQSVVIQSPNEPVWVYADHRRLERALLNLLSNAHRFSPAGASIRIAVEDNGEEVSWTVADSGPGIPLDQQRHLFERFFVGATDRGRGGAGLGLPIVLAIAQAHGGRVEVDSTPGRGSTFRIVVPAGRATERR